MSAVMTLALVAGPVGLLAGGWLLQHEGVGRTFGILAVGQTTVAVAFSVC